MSKLETLKARRDLRRNAGGLFSAFGGGSAGFNALMKYVAAHEGEGISEADAVECWADLGNDKMLAKEDDELAKEEKRKDISKKRSDAGKKGGRPPAPAEEETARRFVSQRMTDEHDFITCRHYRDVWYRFGLDGWHPETDGEMQKVYMTYAQRQPDLAPHAKTTYSKNVLANAASFNLCGVGGTVEKPCWLSTGVDARNVIAFSNGVALDAWKYASAVAEGITPDENHDAMHALSPDLFSGDFVNYEWAAGGKPEKFLAYLERVQPDEGGIDAVKRMLGLILADTGKFEVFWQLYGSGANGKTVLLDVINALVGFRNCASVPLEALAPGTRFQSFPLITAKVNICGELATDTSGTHLAKIEGQFKHCVSGGVIEYERKGIDKEQGRCRARFIMSANSLPTFVDTSDAIWRRLRIIPFPVQIPEDERNADLAEQIIADEMPAICEWALEGLADVIATGFVPDCAKGMEIKAAHRSGCDHERSFLTECGYVAGDSSNWVQKNSVYNDYKDWMSNNGYRPKGMGKFAGRVEQILPSVHEKRMRTETGQHRVFAGLVKEFVEPELL
jgi:P4 family phage/plasmid primase-like protien